MNTTETQAIADRLDRGQREILIQALGDTAQPWPGGRTAAGLARRGLMEYAEHGEYFPKKGRVRWRRTYMATELGTRVAKLLLGLS